MTGRHPAGTVCAVGMAIVLAMVAALFPAPAAVAQPTDDAVDYSVTTVTTTVGSTVGVRVEIGEATDNAGAVAATFAYDDTALTLTACTPLVALAECHSPSDGIVRFAAVSNSEWDPTIALVEFTFTADAIDYDGTVDVQSARWYDALGAELDTNFTGDGVIIAQPGDVNCDQTTNVLDALMIAQQTVGLRFHESTCDPTSPTTFINTGAGDVDTNGSVDIVDALIIARCEVGIVTVLCPAG